MTPNKIEVQYVPIDLGLLITVVAKMNFYVAWRTENTNEGPGNHSIR